MTLGRLGRQNEAISCYQGNPLCSAHELKKQSPNEFDSYRKVIWPERFGISTCAELCEIGREDEGQHYHDEATVLWQELIKRDPRGPG